MIYISWFIDIGLYLEDYLMNKAVTLAGGIREPLLTCSSSRTGYFHSMGAVGTGNTLKLKKWHNANYKHNGKGMGPLFFFVGIMNNNNNNNQKYF